MGGLMSDPRRIPGGYFDPGNGTVWPAPDCGDPDLCETPAHLMRSAWNAYEGLLTGLPSRYQQQRLALVIRGWKALRESERKAGK
jgi:hypothetical protein